MPSNTFLNLPEDKQNRLMDAASREFSAKPYNEASINKIIQEAGIPRGSFYMYFQDKEELFRYLVHGYMEQLLMVLEDGMASDYFIQHPENKTQLEAMLSDFSGKEIEVSIQAVKGQQEFEDNYVDISRLIQMDIEEETE